MSAQCPKCGKPITFLVEYVDAQVRYHVRPCPDPTGSLDRDLETVGDTLSESSFECPECGMELTTNEDEAERILRT